MSPAARREPIEPADVRCVPANEVSWEDIGRVFSAADPHACQCQRFKVVGWIWRDSTLDERTTALRAQTACDHPRARSTSGVVALVDGDPAGWVAVEPRIAYPKLRTLRVPWSGRREDKDDEGVWAVTCFTIRREYRRRGLMYHLCRATVDYARSRGATALEGYPMDVPPGKEITWGELHVGALSVFEEAGFREVHRPTLRRVVMRIDFASL